MGYWVLIIRGQVDQVLGVEIGALGHGLVVLV
jgi:hypothetical protein